MTSHMIRKAVNTFARIQGLSGSKWHLEITRHSDESINNVYSDKVEESRHNPIPLIMGKILKGHSRYQSRPFKL